MGGYNFVRFSPGARQFTGVSTSLPGSTCTHCGSALPADVPESQCPRCLMAQIIEPTQAGDRVTPVSSMTPAELAPHFPQLEALKKMQEQMRTLNEAGLKMSKSIRGE
jgi:hypothetical protein